MNPDPSNCPQCGTALASDSPEGLCPSCLLGGVMAPTEPSAPEPAPSLEAVSSAFPNLEIDSLIGHGGMGAVYKAWQPHLERWVALKVLSTSLSSDQAFADRFTREARVLAKLNHPNIVTLHDFGQAGEYFFLLMEYVDGVNLRQAMRAGRFTSEQALNVVPKICEALQYAHSEGILHRDIKPDNILLDSRGHLKIADFGIAKVVGTDGELLVTSSLGESALTHASTSLGTPQYMAPEQVTDPNKVDHRADIYSLGVVFYEMLTGELPAGKFVPPSQVSQVDGRIDAVVERALEQERGERQQSADEVRTQVETIVQTPPPMPTSEHRKRRFGPRWAVSFIVLGLLVPMLAVLWLRFQMVESTRGQAESEVAMERLATSNTAMEAVSSQLAVETNPAEIAKLTKEYKRAESERDRATRLLDEHGPPTNSRVKASVSFLMLLVISLPFLLIGTWKGWAHLRDRRVGHADKGVGAAMFAALFLPLILLFGAVFALIYIPAMEAKALGRSAGTSIAIVAAFLACFWLVRRTWRWTHRIEAQGASRAVGIGCVIAIVILGILSVPVVVLFTWNTVGVEQAPFSAPVSAAISSNTNSTYCSYTGDELHFLLHYPGDFSSSTGSSSSKVNRTWENDAELQLPNRETVAIHRHSGSPNTLRLNGKAYSLVEGRVFLIDDDANIEQRAFPEEVVRDQSDLDRFVRNLNR